MSSVFSFPVTDRLPCCSDNPCPDDEQDKAKIRACGECFRARRPGSVKTPHANKVNVRSRGKEKPKTWDGGDSWRRSRADCGEKRDVVCRRRDAVLGFQAAPDSPAQQEVPFSFGIVLGGSVYA